MNIRFRRRIRLCLLTLNSLHLNILTRWKHRTCLRFVFWTFFSCWLFWSQIRLNFKLLQETSLSKLWFKQDRTFDLPHCEMLFYFQSPLMYDNVDNLVLASLITRKLIPTVSILLIFVLYVPTRKSSQAKCLNWASFKPLAASFLF